MKPQLIIKWGRGKVQGHGLGLLTLEHLSAHVDSRKLKSILEKRTP